MFVISFLEPFLHFSKFLIFFESNWKLFLFQSHFKFRPTLFPASGSLCVIFICMNSCANVVVDVRLDIGNKFHIIFGHFLNQIQICQFCQFCQICQLPIQVKMHSHFLLPALILLSDLYFAMFLTHVWQEQVVICICYAAFECKWHQVYELDSIWIWSLFCQYQLFSCFDMNKCLSVYDLMFSK